MRYNQYSYTKASEEVMLDELARLGFTIQTTNPPMENLHHFLQKEFSFAIRTSTMFSLAG